MFSWSRVNVCVQVVWLAFASGFALSVCAEQGPGLGQPITADAAAAKEFAVLPDGTGLPAGSGGVAEGRHLYATHCGSCHGDEGQGGPNDRIVGGEGSLASGQAVKTVGSYWPYATTVFDYVRRAMPYANPGSLSNYEVYALTAYILHMNGIVAEDAVLDAETLASVAMPNRNGFRWVFD